MGKGLRESLKYGLNYEILMDFAEAEGCNIEIVAINDTTNYADSLREGIFDIVATRIGRDSLDFSDIGFSWSYDGRHAMAVSDGNTYALQEINRHLNYLVTTGKFGELEKTFLVGYDPYALVESGTRVKRLSPYDAAIKQYAKQLGWDWRMLAALIYKESKFTINNVSPRGAIGLMQVLPSTASVYGIDNLLDPEENIKAGTAYLKAIQDKYFCEGFTVEEQEKFTLAAYNGGVGRITECRRRAADAGKDNHVWENIEVYLTDFREIVAYVDSVKGIYDTFCTICPYSK